MPGRIEQKTVQVKDNRALMFKLGMAAVFIFVFYFYLITMYPSFKLNDSPEVTVAVYNLSLMHPPGYPLYALMGKAASLFPAANAAFRMNLFCAALSLAAVFLAMLISVRIFPRAGIFMTVVLVAFSYIFWNQSIEAKGGIYMLNLVFALAVIYLLVMLKDQFNVRQLYLLAFIYGLSLSNHWQTMLLMLPAVAAAMYFFRMKLRARSMILCAAFFMLGLTPYLYTIFRTDAFSLITWGDTRTISGFFDYVLRRRYNGAGEGFSWVMLGTQFMWAMELFFRNYGLLAVMIIPGIYALYKSNRAMALILAAVIIPISAAVIIFSRPHTYLAVLNDIFLMPVQVLFVFFIVAGIIFAAGMLKDRIQLTVFAAAVIASFLFSSASSRDINDSSNNFTGYDLAMNTLMTMDPGSLYLAEGDYNIFPVMYMLGPAKKRQDLHFASVADLGFDRGVMRVNSNLNMMLSTKALDVNIRELINTNLAVRPVYRNSPSPIFEKVQVTRYPQLPQGILIRILENEGFVSPAVFEAYSYRGLWEYFYKSPDAYLPISWYGWSMYNQAGMLVKQGFYSLAVKLYRKALSFPGDVPKNEMCFYASDAYRQMKDRDNEFIFLKLTLDADPDYSAAYGRIGMIFYGMGDLLSARIYALKCAEQGLKDPDALLLISKLDSGLLNAR